MKKQILLLIAATMAGIMMVTGQNTSAVPGSASKGVSCQDDALHPIPGKPYTYTLEATPAGGNFLWWATKDPNFITTDGDGNKIFNNSIDLLPVDGSNILNAAGNYNNPGTDNTITITWSDALLSNTVFNTNPTFVAAFYEAPATGCSDNFKVFQLNPVKAFVVDILNWDYQGATALGYDVPEEQCIDDVSSAIFNGASMEYEYGENVFIYEVVAANFTGSYTPEFVVSGLNGAQTSVLQWTYDPPTAWGASTVWYNDGEQVITNEDDTSNGVSVYVRLTVTNNNFENNAEVNPAGITFALAVDAVNSVGDYDVDNGDGDSCVATAAADQADVAEQTLLPRPVVKEGTNSTQSANTGLITGNEQN